MNLLALTPVFAAAALCSSPCFAQSIEIPGVGSVPIRGKLGQLLGQKMQNNAASAPNVADANQTSRDTSSPRTTGHDPTSYYT